MNRFKVVICGRNAEDWTFYCLDSVFRQNDDRFDVHITVDPSTDETTKICEEYFFTMVDHELGDFCLAANYTREGALFNQWAAINSMTPEDEDVIVFVDLDDWLIDYNVLSYLRDIYDNEDCMLTYGNYITVPYSSTCHIPSRYPLEVEKNNAYRESAYRVGMLYGHLRTVKYEVLRHIDNEDLLDRNGNWFQTACDSAIMLPSLELAGGRYKCIEKPLYVYNSANPESEWRVRPRQIDNDHYDILTKKKKEPLDV